MFEFAWFGRFRLSVLSYVRFTSAWSLNTLATPYSFRSPQGRTTTRLYCAQTQIMREPELPHRTEVGFWLFSGDRIPIQSQP